MENNNLNQYQRIKKYMRQQAAPAQPPKEEPKEQPKEETEGEVSELEALFAGMTKTEAEALVEEYTLLTSPDGFKRFIQERTAKREEKPTPDQQQLLQEYQEALKTAKPYQVARLKQEFRRRGLEVY